MRSAPAQPKLRHFAAHVCDTSPRFIEALWLGPAGVALRISRASIRAQLQSELMRRFCAALNVLREQVVYVHCGEPEALPNDRVVEPIAPGWATRKR
jgi:hypothetical protein